MYRFLRVLFGGEEKRNEKKFHVDIWSRPHSFEDDYGSTFIKVDEHGKVVGTGNPIWGKPELVHWIGIPWLNSEKPTRLIETTLSHSVRCVNLSIDVTITVVFTSREFDYQELFDVVIAAGFDHINEWISNLFCTAALQDKAVIKAFKNYAEHDRPVLFVEELGNALKNLPFSGHALSNIKQMKVKADLNTATASMQTVYDGT